MEECKGKEWLSDTVFAKKGFFHEADEAFRGVPHNLERIEAEKEVLHSDKGVFTGEQMLLWEMEQGKKYQGQVKYELE